MDKSENELNEQLLREITGGKIKTVSTSPIGSKSNVAQCFLSFLRNCD